MATKKPIVATASAYGNLDDAEFIKYNDAASKKWGSVASIQAQIADLEKKKAQSEQEMTNAIMSGDAKGWVFWAKAETMYAFQAKRLTTKDLASAYGEAQVLEAKRENRGATLKQSGVNNQTQGVGAEAIKNENMLAQNIGQEIQGRVARNTQQARDAMSGVDKQGGAVVARQAARAGQAGYSGSSGTLGAMAESVTAKTDEEKVAIEGYRIGRQNLLMGQADAANTSAENLSGSINKTTTDWTDKSTAAVDETTGALLSNIKKITSLDSFAGNAKTPGVLDSYAAVDSTLETWSLDNYVSTLDSLTSHSANKSTWDQMLLDQGSVPVNPYGSTDTSAISPLTPVAGTQSNMLSAAAAGSPDTVFTLSGSTKKKTGGLL